jgi:putative DNA primase/helicase
VLAKHPLYDAKAFKKDKRPNLVKQSAIWLDYDPKGCYVALEDGTVYSEAQKFLEESVVEGEAPKVGDDGTPVKDAKGNLIIEAANVPYSPVPFNVNGLVEMLGNDVHVPFNVNPPPCWLRGKDQDKLPCDIINVANGLLYYPKRKLLDHTPDYFSTSVLPMEYDEKASCPTFMRFISEVMKGRPHLISGLQEAIGYSLSSNRNMQKIFFGKGPPGTGKGTLARVIQALHGAGNFSNPTMFDLDEKYGLEGTIGKAAMIVTDVTPKMSSMDKAAEFLKGVSGQDNREVRRMAKPAWQGVIGAQIWMFGKHMPNFGVSAEEINRRLLVFPFDVSFVGKPDGELTNKLLAELSGILNWALVGYENLMKRGEFLESEESKEAKKQLLNLSDPVMAFVGDRCEIVADGWIERPLLQAVYEHWSADNAGNTLAPKTLRQRLLDAYQGRVTMDERRGVRYGPRPDYTPLDAARMVDIVKGIRLNAEWRAQVYEVDDWRVDIESEAPGDALTLDETGAPIPSTKWSKWQGMA